VRADAGGGACPQMIPALALLIANPTFAMAPILVCAAVVINHRECIAWGDEPPQRSEADTPHGSAVAGCAEAVEEAANESARRARGRKCRGFDEDIRCGHTLSPDDLKSRSWVHAR
jgi:hypothetical protein